MGSGLESLERMADIQMRGRHGGGDDEAYGRSLRLRDLGPGTEFRLPKTSSVWFSIERGGYGTVVGNHGFSPYITVAWAWPDRPGVRGSGWYWELRVVPRDTIVSER